MNSEKNKKQKSGKKKLFIVIWLALILLLTVLIIALGPPAEKHETIKEVMRDGVLHETGKISLFGVIEVNPALISAYVVTAVLLLAALLLRIFAIPRFKTVPGRLQSIIEAIVEFFSGMARTNSPHRPTFVGSYIFGAGIYVCFGTLFELFGLQAVTTNGESIALPAPLADINGAAAMGITSFLVILLAGLIFGGIKGMLGTLKDFSLPISMSFRLFGALLSGLLVTELVYYYYSLSFVLPVFVGIMFTLIHALVQTYVLVTLVSTFYGEAAEPRKKKEKNKKTNIKNKNTKEVQ